MVREKERSWRKGALIGDGGREIVLYSMLTY